MILENRAFSRKAGQAPVMWGILLKKATAILENLARA
jgi:hypothetical protein